MSDRAFVLSLEGAPWDLFEQSTTAGKLPNFERIRDEGVSGHCQSTEAARTAVAWPSFAAGAEPSDVAVLGLSPAVLESVGQPIPSAADGNVPTEMSCEGSTAVTEPVEVTDYDDGDHGGRIVDDDFEAVEHRLNEVGFV